MYMYMPVAGQWPTGFGTACSLLPMYMYAGYGLALVCLIVRRPIPVDMRASSPLRNGSLMTDSRLSHYYRKYVTGKLVTMYSGLHPKYALPFEHISHPHHLTHSNWAVWGFASRARVMALCRGLALAACPCTARVWLGIGMLVVRQISKIPPDFIVFVLHGVHYQDIGVAVGTTA